MSKSTELLQKLGESNLIKWFNEQYGFSIQKIISIPVGVSGHNYSIEDKKGQMYFLKIYLQKSLEVNNPQGLENTLNLTAQLHERDIANIPYAIRSVKGHVEETWGEYVVTVMNYVHGKSLDEASLSDERLNRLGRIIGQIHQTSTDGVHLPVEPFDLSYALKLRQQMEALEEGDVSRKYVMRLGELILPHKLRLTKHLQVLEQLFQKAQNGVIENVITHGDLIPDNLLLDLNNELFIVDWDTARRSPLERDVWFFMKHETFLEGYHATNPKAHPSVELLSFYMYKRYIEDMVYWIDQILHENTSDEQNETDIEGIKVCCIERYKDIEDQIKMVTQMIV